MARKSKKKKSKIIPVLIFAFVITAVSLTGYVLYRKVFHPNVNLGLKEESFLYIPTGSNFDDVLNILESENTLKNVQSFVLVANRMGYTNAVKAGKYRIFNNMSNKELVQLLRSGVQTPVKLVFNRLRSIQQLGGVISHQIEADSVSITKLLMNKVYLDSIGYNSQTILSLFIPNTYEFYWNTSAREFLNRMQNENSKFWNDSRTALSQKIKMTPEQVSTLASIVEMETAKNDEKPIIAGVYMNRINRNWKLEADPTLIFAAGDYNIKRVLNIHKEIESPYNTYKYAGLPPGPICIPSISSIDAVLNYKIHNYMFFCAKDDFSGYHSFANSYNEHLANARKFQRELNRRKIKS